MKLLISIIVAFSFLVPAGFAQIELDKVIHEITDAGGGKLNIKVTTPINDNQFNSVETRGLDSSQVKHYFSNLIQDEYSRKVTSLQALETQDEKIKNYFSILNNVGLNTYVVDIVSELDSFYINPSGYEYVKIDRTGQSPVVTRVELTTQYRANKTTVLRDTSEIIFGDILPLAPDLVLLRFTQSAGGGSQELFATRRQGLTVYIGRDSQVTHYLVRKKL